MREYKQLNTTKTTCFQNNFHNSETILNQSRIFKSSSSKDPDWVTWCEIRHLRVEQPGPEEVPANQPMRDIQPD